MNLLLSEAARLLDKSESQVRYMIKSGQLPARKTDGRWRIRREDLPRSAGQLRAAEKKMVLRPVASARLLPSFLVPKGRPRLALGFNPGSILEELVVTGRHAYRCD